MTYFRILTVGLATISLVAGNPQLFSFQLGTPPGSPGFGGGPRGPRYESASSGPRPGYSGGSRVRGYQGFGGPPSSSPYESAPPSSSDYESAPPSSSDYESSPPLYGGSSSGSGSPSNSLYSKRPSLSSLYESAPESASSDDEDDSGSPYGGSSPSSGDYQSLSGPPGGGLSYQGSAAKPSYQGRPVELSEGYQSGPPPGYGFESSPSRPQYLHGGPPGGPRGPPHESLPMRIGRGIMGLFASASGPPNFFAPPRSPTYLSAASKPATFYLEPPGKDSPSFYGVRTIASPSKSSQRGVKSPFSFLASETNNQIPRENSYVLASSSGGRPVQSVQQIIAQAAQAQHAKVLQKEQRAHPSGKITHSQIRLAGGGGRIPPQFQSQAYLNPYTSAAQPAGVYSQQLVMTTGPDGNPILVQVQRPSSGAVQYTGQQPAQSQFVGQQQPTVLQYTGQQPPQQYSTIGTAQQSVAAIASSPQQQQQGQIIQYIQPSSSQGPISLPAQPQANFPSVQFLQQTAGQGQISPYTVSPQFLSQQQQPQGGIDISQYSLTQPEPQQQGQQFYQTLPGQSPFGVSSQDGQQILLNQIGQQQQLQQQQQIQQQLQQQQQIQQQLQQQQQQSQSLKQSSSNNQQLFQIQEAIQTHQGLQSENLQQPQQSRQSQAQSGSGSSSNPSQFTQQDIVGAFSANSEQVASASAE